MPRFYTKKSNQAFLSLYDPGAHFDESINAKRKLRQHYSKLYQRFSSLNKEEFVSLKELSKRNFYDRGVTFSVYSAGSNDKQDTEKIFPFDLYPRIVPSKEWEILEKGFIQRNRALNLFLDDIYNQKKILKDKIIPHELIFSSKSYLAEMEGFRPPGNIYTHVNGLDLIKHQDGKYYVLEDNLRCPSGVSYILNNRLAMKRTMPGIFKQYKVHAVENYARDLLSSLQSVAPSGQLEPTCVLLTPGVFNSAYFEHSFLALSMGIELVQGDDLFVEKQAVYMKTIYGPRKVDVIYRRVDDEFIDPLSFRSDSMLGVPGLLSVYLEGNVTLANAPGTGVSDDKAVYAYVPDIIKYYLDEEAILQNVKTYRCEKEDEQLYVLENLENLVLKPVDESGGYGILIGNKASKKELEEARKRIKANPRKYIAQPRLSLSTLPTYCEDSEQFEGRHTDIRLFSLYSKEDIKVLPGGLCRVALERGQLIVNSSQGGGSKDTWVLK